MSKTGTMADRNKILSEHLLYERNMLHYSYKSLQNPPSEQAAYNVLTECFCLHARNLIDFFWENKPLGAKDAVARHFTDNSYNPFEGICPM
jgi:hypothetical protein